MSRSAASGRPERGFALAELLVTISIVGVVFVAVLAALGTAIRSSDIHEHAADANSALVSAAETVKAAEFTSSCASAPAAYQDFVRDNTPLPGGWAVDDLEVVSVTCPSSAVQMITVGVTGPGTTQARQLTVAKAERATTVVLPTTTTTVPPGPGVTKCTTSSVGAYKFGSRVLVLVIASPNQPLCAWPLRVKLTDGTTTTNLFRLGWVWLASISSRPECDDNSCSVTVVDGGGLTVATKAVQT